MLELRKVYKSVSVYVRLPDHRPDLGPGDGLPQAGHGALQLSLRYQSISVLIKHPESVDKLNIIYQRGQVAF